MSDKNTAHTTAQPTLGQTEKKDNTALIVVLVIVGAVVVLPMILGAIVLVAIFSFADNIVDKIDDYDWDIPGDDTTYYADMSREQHESIATLWTLSNDSLINSASVSKKDCLNMKYVAEHHDGDWFTNDICEAETINIASEKDQSDDTQWLYLTDGKSYAIFNVDIYTNEVIDYELSDELSDKISFKTLPLVDTGEAATPYVEVPYDFGDNEDDDEGVEIYIRPTQKS